MSAELSVVVPVCNEQESVPELYRRLTAALSGVVKSFEVVLVDDGSTDRSWEIIRELATRDGRVKGLSFSRNFGHQMAFTAGLDHADGDAVVIMDADLQDPPELLPELCGALAGGVRRRVRGAGAPARRDCVQALHGGRVLPSAAPHHARGHPSGHRGLPPDEPQGGGSVPPHARAPPLHARDGGLARLPPGRRPVRTSRSPRRRDQVPAAKDAPPGERRHHVVLVHPAAARQLGRARGLGPRPSRAGRGRGREARRGHHAGVGDRRRRVGAPRRGAARGRWAGWGSTWAACWTRSSGGPSTSSGTAWAWGLPTSAHLPSPSEPRAGRAADRRCYSPAVRTLALVGPSWPLRGGIARTTTALAAALSDRGSMAGFFVPIRQYPGVLYPGRRDTDPHACPRLPEAQPCYHVLEPWTWRRLRRRLRDAGPDALVAAVLDLGLGAALLVPGALGRGTGRRDRAQPHRPRRELEGALDCPADAREVPRLSLPRAARGRNPRAPVPRVRGGRPPAAAGVAAAGRPRGGARSARACARHGCRALLRADTAVQGRGRAPRGGRAAAGRAPYRAAAGR